jgi:hypothetical protein
MLFEHPSHYDISSVSINSERDFAPVPRHIRAKVNYFGRNSASAIFYRYSNAMDRKIAVHTISRQPLSVKNLVVGRFTVVNESKRADNFTVGQDAI